MDMDENTCEEFTKRENGLKQSPKEHQHRRNRQKKINPVRKTEQNRSVVGKISEQKTSQMQAQKVFQEDLYCVCANIYQAV